MRLRTSFGNGGGTFKPGAEPEHRDRRLAAARSARARRRVRSRPSPLRPSATISSIGIGRPHAIICRASCPIRSPELSSAISSPAFICALARAISASEMVSAALAISSTTSRISSEASAASVPA